MKVIKYSKLIRDRIPEILEARGVHCSIRKINKREYRRCLVKKMEEEAKELQNFKNKKEMINELVDLMEIFDGIIKEFKLTRTELAKAQRLKRQKRGGFARKLYLIKTQE